MVYNASQIKVIHEKPMTSMCVMACAGSGKTTTLAARVRWLTEECGVDPAKILVISFTVTAARQIAKKIGLRAVMTNTVDAIAASFLRDYATSMCDVSTLSVEQYLPQLLIFLRSPQADTLLQNITHVFIDEFQDADQNQHELAKLLHEKGVVVTVVGDPAQNIYSFRDSEVRFITDFTKEFPGAVQHTLDINYRCSDPIIALANSIPGVIQAKPPPHREEKPFSDPKPHIVRTNKTHAFILKEIKRLGLPLNKCAVLARNNWQINEMESMFALLGTPTFKLIGEEKQQQQSLGLCLSTIHRSKGLEWDAVFLVGCDEGIIPSFASSLEEEYRLFYVAATRCRKHLYFIHDKTPSRFLAAIPPDLLDGSVIGSPALYKPLSPKEDLMKDPSAEPPNIESKETSQAPHEPLLPPPFIKWNSMESEFCTFVSAVLMKMMCNGSIHDDFLAGYPILVRYQRGKKISDHLRDPKIILQREQRAVRLGLNECDNIPAIYDFIWDPISVYHGILRDCFASYTDKNIVWRDALEASWGVGLGSSLAEKRFRPLYITMGKPMPWIHRLIPALESIKRFLSSYISDGIHLIPMRKHGVHGSFYTIINENKTMFAVFPSTTSKLQASWINLCDSYRPPHIPHIIIYNPCLSSLSQVWIASASTASRTMF